MFGFGDIWCYLGFATRLNGRKAFFVDSVCAKYGFCRIVINFSHKFCAFDGKFDRTIGDIGKTATTKLGLTSNPLRRHQVRHLYCLIGQTSCF